MKKEGVKHSNNKLDMEKLFKQFPLSIQGVILASHFGHEKYKKTDDPVNWDNFKKVPDAYNQYKSAEIRHELETIETEESGIHPEFHILWNSMARFEMWAKDNNINIKQLAEDMIPKWREQFK